jgi:hypothetical protein
MAGQLGGHEGECDERGVARHLGRSRPCLGGRGADQSCYVAERAHPQQAAKDAANLETLRHYTATAFSELFALNHAASWVTWFAGHAPHAVNQQMAASFDAETHSTFPKLLSAMAMVATVNWRVYEQLRLLQKGVFDLWERVAAALHQESDPDAALQALRDCLPAAEELDDRLPKELERLMKTAGSEPRR